MKNRKALTGISLFAALCILMSIFTVFSFAAGEGVRAYVTLSSEGELVTEQAKILVTDIDKDGALTINDALVITHREFYPDGTAGFENSTTQWGLSIKKLWGVENGGSYGYYVNNGMAMGLTDVLNDGDYLYAFSYKDAKYYSDSFSYFTVNTIPADSASFTVTLMKNGFDTDWNPVQMPAEGAVITIDGVDTEFVTDSNGEAQVTVPDSNRHIISAKSESEILTPPVIIYDGLYTGFSKEFGDTYYYVNSVKQTYFKTIGSKTYYFDNDGKMLTGLKSITNKKGNTYKYFFNKDGSMYNSGWKKTVSNGKTYYYYFSSNGVMYTGWKNITNKNGNTYKYYFGDSGIMRTGWQSIKNSKGVAYKYYFGDNGVMRTGFKDITNSKGKTYRFYFGANGYMRTGWQSIKNSKGVAYKYYFGDNGVMRTGWQKIGSKKYYFHTNGVMLTGWQKINGQKYYFDYDGVYYSASQIKAYVNAYNKLLAYAKLGQYNAGSKRYIYAFDTLSYGTGLKICCIEYDAGKDELYISYVMNNGDFQSRNAVLVQKKVTNKMEITFAYKTIKNGKTTDLNGATAVVSKRAYTDGAKINCSNYSGTKYTQSDYSQLMTSQTAHIMKELSKYLEKNSTVTLSSLGYYSYK